MFVVNPPASWPEDIQALSADGCHTATNTGEMWVSLHIYMKYACRRMENPPPTTQDGREEFYRKLVRSEFMKQAHKERC